MVTSINNNTINRSNNSAYSQDKTFYQQGLSLFNAKNYFAAWTAFDNAIKINPKEQIYYYMRAACSVNLGHYNAALTDYNTALRLAKTNDEKGWIHFDMAILYNQIGNEQQALSHITTAARLGHAMAQQVCREAGISY